MSFLLTTKFEPLLKGKGFGYGLFDKNSEYTNTISARYYKDGSEILIAQENKNPRKLTPREAARLQGFPDDYQIVSSNVQAYKQFGNSVSVPVIKAIALEMKKTLSSVNYNKTVTSKKSYQKHVQPTLIGL